MLKDNILKKIINIKNILKVDIKLLARKSGVAEHTVSEILKGNTQNPSVYTVAKIATALKSSVDELVRESSTESTDQEDLKIDLAKSCVTTVIDLLRQKKLEVSLEECLYLLQEIYLYCLHNKLKAVDIKFASQFINDTVASIKT